MDLLSSSCLDFIQPAVFIRLPHFIIACTFDMYNFPISSQNSSQGPKVDILAAWRSGDTDAAVDSLTRRRLQHYRVVSCAVGYCTFANVNDRHSVDTATKSAKHGSLGSL